MAKWITPHIIKIFESFEILCDVIFAMYLDTSQLIGPFVLFGNGEIPSHQIPLNQLKKAKSILCADGGATQLTQLGFAPNIILGDLDSVDSTSFDCPIIPLKNQHKTDLQKSLDWCIENGITELSLIGFSGKDDDHWMAALWTLATYHEKINLTFYSNYSMIQCVKGDQTFESVPGQIISIIPTHEKITLSVSGLKYPINDAELLPPSFGTRNEAIGNSFNIIASDLVWVFINYNQSTS